MSNRRFRVSAIAGAAAGLLVAGLAIVALAPSANAAGGPNLAAGRPTAESSHNQTYASGNIADGNQATYWESANNAFPQWVQVDLGSSVSVDQVTLKLPAGWGARTETLSLQFSTDGASFSTLVGSTGYTFDPSANNNTVAISFGATSVRYVRANVTANTGWPAGQRHTAPRFVAADRAGHASRAAVIDPVWGEPVRLVPY